MTNEDHKVKTIEDTTEAKINRILQNAPKIYKEKFEKKSPAKSPF